MMPAAAASCCAAAGCSARQQLMSSAGNSCAAGHLRKRLVNCKRCPQQIRVTFDHLPAPPSAKQAATVASLQSCRHLQAPADKHNKVLRSVLGMHVTEINKGKGAMYLNPSMAGLSWQGGHEHGRTQTCTQEQMTCMMCATIHC
jgi:hypothetical protein